jgi:hypothetical protein
MKNLTQFSAVAAIGFLCFSAQAQSTKPGLWEVSSKMDAPANSEMAKQMAEMHKQMASMPPAQRKMMEEMMAKQGVNVSFGAGGVTTIKVCVTPEMASLPPIEQQKDCTYQFPPRSGNSQRFSFQCKQPQSSGEGEMTFKGADDYEGKMNVTTTEKGKKETVSMRTSGKFLGSSCGAIKPFAQPKG